MDSIMPLVSKEHWYDEEKGEKKREGFCTTQTAALNDCCILENQGTKLPPFWGDIEWWAEAWSVGHDWQRDACDYDHS